jgi:hypothetical protein
MNITNFTVLSATLIVLILAAPQASTARAADQPAPASQAEQPAPAPSQAAPGMMGGGQGMMGGGQGMMGRPGMMGGQGMMGGPGMMGGEGMMMRGPNMPAMMGGCPAMAMMAADPKTRRQMMAIQGRMMQEMGELMIKRGKELEQTSK